MQLRQPLTIAAFYHAEIATLAQLSPRVEVVATATGPVIRVDIGLGRVATLTTPLMRPGPDDDHESFTLTITDAGTEIGGGSGYFGEQLHAVAAHLPTSNRPHELA